MRCVEKRNNFFETSSKWATACHRSRQERRGVALQGAIGGRVRYDRHGGPKTTNTCRSTDVGHWQPPTVAHLPTTVSKNSNFPLWILIHAYYLADQRAHVFKGKFVCVYLKCDFEAHFLYQLLAQFHFHRYTLVLEGGTRGFQGKYSINLEKAHNHSVRKTSILRHVYNCFYMARVCSPYFRNDKFWEPRVAFQALIWENSDCLEQHFLGLGSYKWCFREINVANDK